MSKVERERTNLLFAIATAIGLFSYYELGRRQRIGEAREESRRHWVDGQLARLNESELGHRERGEGVRNIFRALVATATIAVGVVAVVGLLLSSHAI